MSKSLKFSNAQCQQLEIPKNKQSLEEWLLFLKMKCLKSGLHPPFDLKIIEHL